MLGKFPLPVEVIPMARSYVARELVQARRPARRGAWASPPTTATLILDVHGLSIVDPAGSRPTIDRIAGVVTVGLFARRGADVILLGTDGGVQDAAVIARGVRQPRER